MRAIRKIVLHHTAVLTTKQPSDDKMIQSMQRTHAARIPQWPDKNGSTIAYHYYIGKLGRKIDTRDIASVGHANSNRAVNNEAINIVLHGNFDVEKPTSIQLDQLNKLLTKLLDIYPDATIHGHKDFSNKSCPGDNFPLDFYKSKKFIKMKTALARLIAKSIITWMSALWNATIDVDMRKRLEDNADYLRKKFEIDDV